MDTHNQCSASFKDFCYIIYSWLAAYLTTAKKGHGQDKSPFCTNYTIRPGLAIGLTGLKPGAPQEI
jgi:hypothetical protein